MLKEVLSEYKIKNDEIYEKLIAIAKQEAQNIIKEIGQSICTPQLIFIEDDDDTIYPEELKGWHVCFLKTPTRWNITELLLNVNNILEKKADAASQVSKDEFYYFIDKLIVREHSSECFLNTDKINDIVKTSIIPIIERQYLKEIAILTKEQSQKKK